MRFIFHYVSFSPSNILLTFCSREMRACSAIVSRLWLCVRVSLRLQHPSIRHLSILLVHLFSPSSSSSVYISRKTDEFLIFVFITFIELLVAGKTSWNLRSQKHRDAKIKIYRQPRLQNVSLITPNQNHVQKQGPVLE